MKIDGYYVLNSKTGEWEKLEAITDICIEDSDEQYIPAKISATSMNIKFEFKIQPKTKLKLLYGVSNNFIRLHGGKPLRTIKKRFF